MGFDLFDIGYTEETFSEYQDLVDYVESHLDKPCEYFIAGGSLADLSLPNRNTISDIDIYFESQAHMDKFLDALIVKTLISESFSSINAITLSTTTPIQLITLFKDTPNEVLDRFDLNKSKIGINQNKEVFQHRTFSHHYPGGSYLCHTGPDAWRYRPLLDNCSGGYPALGCL